MRLELVDQPSQVVPRLGPQTEAEVGQGVEDLIVGAAQPLGEQAQRPAQPPGGPLVEVQFPGTPRRAWRPASCSWAAGGRGATAVAAAGWPASNAASGLGCGSAPAGVDRSGAGSRQT